MTTKFKIINETSGFSREYKKLTKRFSSLPDDLETFIKTQLNLEHKLNIHNNGIVLLHANAKNTISVHKARKFACKSLKGKGSRSGIRIIYAYLTEEDIIEFIEIYYKGDKPNEDKQGIKRYIQSKL